MPKSNLTVNWLLVEELLQQKGWSLEDLKNKVSLERGTLGRACARSVDNAKAGRPVIKATVRAIARALGVVPPERIVNGYVPNSNDPRIKPRRVIEVAWQAAKALESFEDLMPLLDELRRLLDSGDDMDAPDVSDGSLRIFLELTPEDAVRLDELFGKGELTSLGVTGCWGGKFPEPHSSSLHVPFTLGDDSQDAKAVLERVVKLLEGLRELAGESEMQISGQGEHTLPPPKS